MRQRFETEDEPTTGSEWVENLISEAWFASAGRQLGAHARLDNYYTRRARACGRSSGIVPGSPHLTGPLWELLTREECDQLEAGMVPEGMPKDVAEAFTKWRDGFRDGVLVSVQMHLDGELIAMPDGLNHGEDLGEDDPADWWKR